MDRKNKVTIIILTTIAIIAIIIAIFATAKRNNNVREIEKQYRENITILNNVIGELKAEISKYQKEIEKTDLEREAIRKELNLIINDYKKNDSRLVNGSCNDNLLFLSEFLSKDDTLRE